MAAQLQTVDRRARQRKLMRYAGLRECVIERIKNGWTPKQIGGRMRLDGGKPRVCQEKIYRHVYSREGVREELWWHLPTHRMTRRPRHARKRQPPKFGRELSILFRPEAVAHRTEFGHWEGDLVLFQQRFGQSNVTSLVERVSRSTVILKNATKRSRPVMGEIVAAFGASPFAARRSVTFDCGSEFVTWPHLQAETGTRSWFCDLQAPHQKGAVENTNRHARRWLPRERDIRQLTDADIRAITDKMNATPRKCLGWKTPAEVFAEKMVEVGGRQSYHLGRRKSHFG